MKKLLILSAIFIATNVFAETNVSDDYYQHMQQRMQGYGMPGMHGYGMRGMPNFMRMMDIDNDGKISIGEMASHHDMMFTRFDRNYDGTITQDETRGRMFTRVKSEADFNNDNKITKEEFISYSNSQFKEMDTDNDGYLMEDENKNYARASRFKKMDVNNDGSISRKEFLNYKYRTPQKRR